MFNNRKRSKPEDMWNFLHIIVYINKFSLPEDDNHREQKKFLDSIAAYAKMQIESIKQSMNSSSFYKSDIRDNLDEIASRYAEAHIKAYTGAAHLSVVLQDELRRVYEENIEPSKKTIYTILRFCYLN